MFFGRVGLVMLTVVFSTSLGARTAYAKKVEPAVVETTTTTTKTETVTTTPGFSFDNVRERYERLFARRTEYTADNLAENLKEDVQKPEVYLPLGAVLLLIAISVFSKAGSGSQNGAPPKPVQAAGRAVGAAASTVAAAGSATVGAVKSAAVTTKEAVKSAAATTADAVKSAAHSTADAVKSATSDKPASADKRADSGSDSESSAADIIARLNEPSTGFFGDLDPNNTKGIVGVPAGVPGFGGDARGNWRDLSIDEQGATLNNLRTIDLPGPPGAWRNQPSMDEADLRKAVALRQVAAAEAAAEAEATRGEWRDLYDPVRDEEQRSIGAPAGLSFQQNPSFSSSTSTSSSSTGRSDIGRSLSASASAGGRSRVVSAGSTAAAAVASPSAPARKSASSSPTSSGGGGSSSAAPPAHSIAHPSQAQTTSKPAPAKPAPAAPVKPEPAAAAKPASAPAKPETSSKPIVAGVWPPQPQRQQQQQPFKPVPDSPYSSGAAAAARAILHPSMSSSDAIDSGADAIARAIRESAKGPVQREEPVPRPPAGSGSATKAGSGGGAVSDLKIAYNPNATYVPQADSGDATGAAAAARAILHPSIDGGEAAGGAEKLAQSILHPSDEQDPGFKSGGGRGDGDSGGGGGGGGGSASPRSPSGRDSGGGSSGSSSGGSATQSRSQSGSGPDHSIAHPSQEKSQVNVSSGQSASAGLEHSIAHPSQEHSQVNVSSASSSSSTATASGGAQGRKRPKSATPEKLRDGSVYFSYDVLSIDEEELEAVLSTNEFMKDLKLKNQGSKKNSNDNDKRGGGGGNGSGGSSSNGGGGSSVSLPKAPSPLSSVSRSDIRASASSSGLSTFNSSSSSSSSTFSSNNSSDSSSAASGKRNNGNGRNSSDAHPVAFAAALSISAGKSLVQFGSFLFGDVAPAMGKVLTAKAKTIPPTDPTTTSIGASVLMLGLGLGVAISHSPLMS